ncbi:MAG: ADP-ribosylation factor-like protein [Candidatus Korarchaeota archaeon]
MRDVYKVSVIGLPQTGKTSIVKLLCEGKVTKEYSPTIGLEIDRAVVNGVEIVAWDYGGKKQFQPLWKEFLAGTSIVMVVTDSTTQNVMETKKLIEELKKTLPHANIIVIANKQDLAGAIPAAQIENMVNVKTVGISAINQSCREKLLLCLREVLYKNISA